MSGTLALVGTANAIVAAVFAATGVRLALRRVEPQHRLAMRAIALWWLAVALLQAVQAAETFAVAFGSASVQVLQADRYLNGAFLGLGCWGLAFSIAYIWNGNRVWAWRLAPIYIIATAAHWALSALDPVIGYEVEAYRFDLEYVRPLIETWPAPIVVATVGGTMVVVPLVYLWFGRKLGGRQRRRANLVSFAVLAWGLTGAVAHITRSPLADFLTVTVMAAVAAVCAYIAYFPLSRPPSGDPPGPFVEVVHPPIQPKDLLYR